MSASRRREVALAGHLGDLVGARAALADPDPAIRATALGALHRASGLSESDLAAATGDPSPIVRRRAAHVAVAASHGPLPVRVPLLPLLDDEDPTVVEVAAWASGELAPPEPGAVARLRVLAGGHDDALVREAAVAALGAIGDVEGLPEVLAAMDDRATVRRRAVIALAAFEGPEVDAALARARSDRDWQVRQAAEDLS